MNLTSASTHTSRSSVSEATPFFFILAFIIEVAMASMPGSMETTTGMGTGMGMAGLASGLMAMPLRSLRSNCRP